MSHRIDFAKRNKVPTKHNRRDKGLQKFWLHKYKDSMQSGPKRALFRPCEEAMFCFVVPNIPLCDFNLAIIDHFFFLGLTLS